MLLIGLSCLAFIGFFTIHTYRNIDSAIAREIESVRAVASVVEEETHKHFRQRIISFTNFDNLGARKPIIKAFIDRNRKELLKTTLPFLKIFQQENPYFSSLSWITPDNLNFLRTHRPDMHGDDVAKKRPDIVAANKTHKAVAGYEVAGLGLEYRLLQPLSYKGQHVGLVQFGIKSDSLLDTINEKLKLPVGLAIPNQWFTFTNSDRVDNFFTTATHAVKSKQVDFINLKSLDIDWTLDQQRIAYQGKNFVIAKALSLKNFKGQERGYIFAVLDISESLDSLETHISFLVFTSFLILLLSFAVLYPSYNRLLGRIFMLNEQLEQNNKELENRVNGRTLELNKNKERFQEIAESMADWIWETDHQGLYSYVSEGGERTLGYQPGEFLGKRPDDLMPEAEVNRTKETFLGYRSRKEPFSEKETIFLHKDGSLLFLSVSGKPILSSDGEFLGYRGVVRNITERKHAEQALKNNEEHLRTVFEAADNVAFVTTDIGGENTLIKSFSPGAENIFGYTAEEVIGRRVAILHPLGVEKDFTAGQCALRERGEGYSGEETMVRKSGEQFPALVTINPLYNNAGELIGTVGVTIDITDRKQAEQERLELETQLRQKYKMEAVGVMAGGMAHNFNNNLSIILGNVELSQMKVQNPEIHGLLSNAKIAILRSRDLVSQIMTYSRKGNPAKVPLQLPLILDETIKLLRSTMPTTVQLNQSISEACKHISINADASQIQECLLNLGNNAVQAMDEQGTLDISLDLVKLQQHDLPELGQQQPGSYIKLSIQDSGCGIAPDIREKIFDPFFTTKELYEGTGMGLATVQGIIDQHHGIIQVSSTLGKGTCFNLYFPTIEQGPIEASGPINEELAGGSEKILFIDDDEMLAKLGELMLTEMGYQVTMMTDSVEALKLFTTDPAQFDLLITDQTMPEITGKELIQKLKKIRPDIPTIICTGFSSKLDEEEAQRLGASAFMMKPLDLPELLRVIRRVLDGKEKA